MHATEFIHAPQSNINAFHIVKSPDERHGMSRQSMFLAELHNRL